MKFPKGCKLDKAAAKEAGRYAMAGVSIEADGLGVVAVATDGRMLAVVPLELEEGEALPVARIVPKEAVAAAAKGHGRVDATIRTDESTAHVVNGCASIHKLIEGQFPRWRDVVARIAEPEYTMALDVGLLERLVDALGCGTVVLTFSGAGQPIRVQPIGEGRKTEGSYGLIMPITVDGNGKVSAPIGGAK